MCNTENKSPFILKSIKIKNLAWLIKGGERERMAYLWVSVIKAGHHLDSTNIEK